MVPSPFPIWKTCTEPINLTDYDGRTVNIEKGVKIILPINAFHNHPDYYTNPEKFDPDRYDQSTGGVKRLKDAGVFMPFGNGPRQCLGNFPCLSLKTIEMNCDGVLTSIAYILGMRVAVSEIKVTLYTLVKNFEFSLKPAITNPSSPIGMLFFSQNTAELEIKLL